jgi:hypothetical protein
MKIRGAFVANSSSSSFLIIGKMFDNEEDADSFQSEIGGSQYGVRYIDGYDKSGYMAGFDIDPGLAEGCSGDASKLIKSINEYYERLKKVMGDEKIVYRGYAGYDG